MKPLEGVLVLDLAQFLAGPAAALRLADLGARVIKIERPEQGDLCRKLYLSELMLDGDSTLFHSINRNKQSVAVDLKDSNDRQRLHALIAKADVLIANFRPGVLHRLELDAETLLTKYPRLVHAEVTGYGSEGAWSHRPGQDLLVQALSGLTWLSGNEHDPPTPVGLAIVDMAAGAYLVQGILACLLRRERSGRGGSVHVSLLEAALDLQFEGFTTFLNSNEALPQRSAISNGQPYLAAPYGIYATADGFLALAMGSVAELAKLLECPELQNYADPQSAFSKRDEIKGILQEYLKQRTTQDWLERLETGGYWAAEVLNWSELAKTSAFKALRMTQTVRRDNGQQLSTTRCPIRIDGAPLFAERAAPRLGEHTQQVLEELGFQTGDDQ